MHLYGGANTLANLADVQEFARGGTLIDDATAIVLRRE